MQVSSTSYHTSPYLTQGGADRSQGASSALAGSGGDGDGGNTGAGISTYDFTSMSPAQMRSTVNDLIRSGKMSLDESSGLVGIMSPPAMRWAGSGTPPSAEEFNRIDNQPVDAMAALRGGIAGAQSRGDTKGAEALGQTLVALQRLQGGTASVDIRA